jgi:intracellular septation protein
MGDIDSRAPAARSRLKPWLDLGPLLAFFLVNAKWGLLVATAALVPLSLLALFLSWRIEGEVSPIALYGTGAIVVFGGLTLAFRDENFIKIKVSVINALLGGILALGLLRGKSLLKELLGRDWRMTETGWRLLTMRFAGFFFVLAGLNEVLRRVLSSDAWAAFKVFGLPGASVVFMLLQMPLLRRHALEEPLEEAEG